MTIEDLGAWGDFIGGVAVVAGLIFVGIQLKIGNRETRLKAGKSTQTLFSICRLS